MSPGVIVFLFMKFQLHLNTFFFFHLYEAKFYFTRHSHVRNFHWRICRGVSGGEYPQNALVRFKTCIRMFKMVDYAEFVRSCVYWFENSI